MHNNATRNRSAKSQKGRKGVRGTPHNEILRPEGGQCDTRGGPRGGSRIAALTALHTHTHTPTDGYHFPPASRDEGLRNDSSARHLTLPICPAGQQAAAGPGRRRRVMTGQCRKRERERMGEGGPAAFQKEGGRPSVSRVRRRRGRRRRRHDEGTAGFRDLLPCRAANRRRLQDCCANIREWLRD